MKFILTVSLLLLCITCDCALDRWEQMDVSRRNISSSEPIHPPSLRRDDGYREIRHERRPQTATVTTALSVSLNVILPSTDVLSNYDYRGGNGEVYGEENDVYSGETEDSESDISDDEVDALYMELIQNLGVDSSDHSITHSNGHMDEDAHSNHHNGEATEALASTENDDESSDDEFFDANETFESTVGVTALADHEATASLQQTIHNLPEDRPVLESDSEIIGVVHLGHAGNVLADALYNLPENSRVQISVDALDDDLENIMSKAGDDGLELVLVVDSDDGEDDDIPITFDIRRPITLNLSNPNPDDVEMVNGEHDGVDGRIFTPKYGVDIVAIMDGDEKVWKGESCQGVTYYRRDDNALLSLQITRSNVTYNKFLEKDEGEWTNVSEHHFDKQLEAMKNGAENAQDEHEDPPDDYDVSMDDSDDEVPTHEDPPDSDDEPLESTSNLRGSVGSATHSKDTQKVPSVDILDSADFMGASMSANLQGTQLGEQDSPLLSDGEPETLHLKGSQSQLKKPKVLLTDKIDPSMFTAKESEEDGVPLLELTARNGLKPKGLVYDRKKIWYNSEDPILSFFLISRATIYFDKDTPKLAIVTTKDNKGHEYQVYKWYFADKWQDNTRDGHNVKLAELKKQYKNARD